MKLAMIIIGDEILSGRTVDANGPWLTKFLASKGLELNEINIVHDDESLLDEALTKAFNHNDIVMTTGGLGPTEDDKTKKVCANYFGKALKESSKTIEVVSKNYAQFEKVWAKENNFYHIFPEDFEALDNPAGLAPGLFYQSNGKTLFCAPGVPREFQKMTDQVFWPKIKNQLSDKQRKTTFSIRTVAIPEEILFFELCPGLWEKLSEFGKVSSLPHNMGVDIVITLDEEGHEEAQKKIIEIMENTAAKDNVWQYGNLELPEYILQKAREKGLKIAFAESCTGGLTSSLITDISGSSDVFLGSIVSYANEVKENVLGVKADTLKNHGAVSVETALEMARGALKVTGADITISFSGISGPTGGSKEKPVGTVAIGWATKTESDSKIYNFKGGRIKLKERFAHRGLYKLLELINS
jgi:nicotinamide-nucleotide amidase